MRRAGDVHQAVYADVVARERTAYAQVAQRHSVYGIFSPQIEWGIVWIATEGDGAARHKLELLLDEILNGELVGAVVYHIVAKHVERALVEVVGANYAISVEGDVIARLLVHDQLEREVLVGVYEEVDAHIRFEIDVILSLFHGWSPVQAVHDIRHNLVPVDKALVADSFRTCHIIYKDAARFGLGVDIDDGFAALAVDAYLARGIDGAIEGVVAKLAGIEAQEVVRLDIEVVTQPGEVLVVDASAQDGYVAVAVEDGIILYEDIIWDSVGTERIEGIIGVELLEVHLAVSGKVAHEIDVFQIAHHIEMAIAPGFYLVHETATEILEEFHAGALGIDTQVDIVALRRDVSVDECLMLRTIIGNCMDINLFELLVEVDTSMEHTERSVFEGKLLHV